MPDLALGLNYLHAGLREVKLKVKQAVFIGLQTNLNTYLNKEM